MIICKNSNSIIYLFLISFAIQYKIFSGLYFIDFVLLVFLVFSVIRKKILINQKILSIILFLAFPAILSLFINIIFFRNNINTRSFFLPYNSLLFLIYYTIFENMTANELNFNIVLWILALPCIISILMFFSPTISKLALSIYHIEKFPAFGRFGGIYGRDVNTFGFYSTILLVMLIFLKQKNKILIQHFVPLLTLFFFSIIISGMRAGIISIFLSLILLSLKRPKMLKKLCFYVFITVVLVLVLLSSIKILNPNLFYYFQERFSISYLIGDFTGVKSNSGNLSQYLRYFNNVVDNANNKNNYFFGLDSSQDMVDSLYFDFFIKYGFSFWIFAFIALIYVYLKIKKEDDLIFIFYFSIIISLKGIFILNNSYLFLVALYLCVIRKSFFQANTLNSIK